jgi:hypothetical protein
VNCNSQSAGPTIPLVVTFARGRNPVLPSLGYYNPTTQQSVCSAVSEESVCSGCIMSISHTISHGTTMTSIHFRLVQDISCSARGRVIFLVRLQRMTIMRTAFRLASTPAHTDQRDNGAVTAIYEQQISRVSVYL